MEEISKPQRLVRDSRRLEGEGAIGVDRVRGDPDIFRVSLRGVIGEREGGEIGEID